MSFGLAVCAGLIALVIAFTGSLLVALLVGGLVLAVVLVVAVRGREPSDAPGDPSRRRFLALLGGIGLAALVGGAAVGRAAKRVMRPDPQPALEAMASDLGSDALELVRRTYHPERSGDLQLFLAPGSSSNYAQESMSLLPQDPRSSHASVWMYLERVPIVVWSPGLVEPSDSTERVTLADLAPTTAALMGFDGFDAPDGTVLPGITAPVTPPKVIVTFVIDGGGWNVLQQWPDSWPNLKRLFAEGATYRDAIIGSFPAVTACAHATIGTGAFPRTHGITGHNIRDGEGVRKAYGQPGAADPSDILIPTLADRWVQESDGNAWVGELGYQIWHLGMLGRGGTPLGEKPVAVYYDEDHTGEWQPQNPELYRLPKEVPTLADLEEHKAAYADPAIDTEYDRFAPGLRAVCCTPPIIEFQGDLIEATIRSEEVGHHDATDLLYINFKSPDYTGHVYNMLSLRTRFALEAVDEQIGRLAARLQDTFAPGEFVLIVAADHGQCPTVDEVGGVRLDPLQLEEDIEAEFGDSVYKLVQSVVPSEVYLSRKAMIDGAVTRDDVAAFLKDYRYGDNIGPYVREDAIQGDRLDQLPFTAVLSTDFIAGLETADLAGYGPGGPFTGSDPGIPPVSW